MGRRKQTPGGTKCTLCIGYGSPTPIRVEAYHFWLIQQTVDEHGVRRVDGHLKGRTPHYARAGDVVVLDGWVPLDKVIVPDQRWHTAGLDVAFAESCALLAAFRAPSTN